MRNAFVVGVLFLVFLSFLAGMFFPIALWCWVILGPLVLLGIRDYFQTEHAIIRNFPVLGHVRYLFELIRPELYQYFVESDTEGVPFGRDRRSLIYQRSKDVRDTVPFGTKEDLYEVGYEWVNHSMAPLHLNAADMRLKIGGKDCQQPYSCSLLNISAMSFGSLSRNAVLALSGGAKMGGFAHNTGEGGVSSYHIEGGGDLIWQVGTGYFGCRNDDGTFCPDRFAKTAAQPNIKMIEIKLSQGAKPGHGGILPGTKVTNEIATIRGVPVGQDVLSPPGHSVFSTPIGLLEFVAQVQKLSGGKPVGIKLCVGKRREFLAICKAMRETKITPDFIAVDGGEGGTGAAPLEFSNHIGSPLIQGLIFVQNALTGFSLREEIRLLASGKVSSAFEMLKLLAIGADGCYSARAMLMAVGCIQALKCNSNHCPTGVATQNESLMAGLVPSDKIRRVANYHRETIHSLSEMLGALGLENASQLRPWHVMCRVSPSQTRHYGEIYEFLEKGALLQRELPESFQRACQAASAQTFNHREA
jgi:glutamate synthase domain-containing protein 2